MHSRVYEHLEDNNLIYENQYGFRKKHSTNHAITYMIEKIKRKLDEKQLVAGVFIDLEKAFDTVNHNILLSKLSHYGISGPALAWFTSYLNNRHQRVSIDGNMSDYRRITRGVPQVSILGPLLFLIYLNDLHNAIKNSTTIHFADDTELTCWERNANKLRRKLNEDLQRLFEWLCANRLSLNATKTEFIIFKPNNVNIDRRIILKINNTKIFESKKIKYLGLIVDDRLQWKYHILELRKKLGMVVGIIHKLKNLNVPTPCLRQVYFSLFQSYLTYGILGWGFAKTELLDKIRLLQKKVVQIISGKKDNIEQEFKKLQILKVDDLIEKAIAILLWEYECALLPKSFQSMFPYVCHEHHSTTRQISLNLFAENRVNTERFGRASLHFKGPKIANKLKRLGLFKINQTKRTFGKHLQIHLLNK